MYSTDFHGMLGIGRSRGVGVDGGYRTLLRRAEKDGDGPHPLLHPAKVLGHHHSKHRIQSVYSGHENSIQVTLVTIVVVVMMELLFCDWSLRFRYLPSLERHPDHKIEYKRSEWVKEILDTLKTAGYTYTEK